MSVEITEELDFTTDTSHEPEVMLVHNPNYSGKMHIASKLSKGYKYLCRNGKVRGVKVFRMGKLSQVTCKNCLVLFR